MREHQFLGSSVEVPLREPSTSMIAGRALAVVLARYGGHSEVYLEDDQGGVRVVECLADHELGAELFASNGDEVEPVYVLASLQTDPSGRVEFRIVPTRAGRTPTSRLVLQAETEESPPYVLAADVARRIDTLLLQAAVAPLVPLGQMDVLDDRDKALLLGAWNGTHVDYEPTTLHQLFDDQAARTPDAPAIVDGGRTWTYADVEGLSNRIGNRLRNRVNDPGDVIAVCLPRSAYALIVQIAVMKAGGAFCYIAPEEPPVRRNQMLDVCRPVAVVDDRDTTPAGFVYTITLENLLAPGPLPDTAPPNIASATSAAYVLFTSGSSGTPKAVLRPHRMQTSRVALEQRMYGLTSKDRHLMKSVPFFREFFWAMATGGAVVVARPGGERDDAYLVRLIREQGITVASFVPSMLRVLLSNPDFRRGELPLRHLFTAGEAFDPTLEIELRSQGLAVHVTYTLAEADYVTHRGDDTRGGAGTVGRPLDMRIYLCDPAGRLVPPGGVGEIYAAGPGVATGYLNRQDLTAERFLPNAFEAGGDQYAIVYRTGDLGRFREDGMVQFLGRADAQVKVRGQRVEPVEVEVALRSHPSIENCLVSAIPDELEGNALVAYVVSGVTVDGGALRQWISERVPAAFVPTHFVHVPTLPLLPSGKVDRAGVRVTTSARPASLGAPAPPETALEAAICDVWSAVLGMDDIGAEDVFTNLGGTSLKMMLLRSALELRLGRPVDIAVLVENPTPYDLAQALDGDR